MLRSTTLALISSFILFQSSEAINACPGTDTVYTGKQGIRYRICPGTDYTGPSLKVTPKIASTQACAQLCDTSLDCFKGVYDTQTKDCHLKATAGIKWQANARFDVIQAEQINIARCPYDEASYKNSAVSLTVTRYLVVLTNNC